LRWEEGKSGAHEGQRRFSRVSQVEGDSEEELSCEDKDKEASYKKS
jgi:hypothetical protein